MVNRILLFAVTLLVALLGYVGWVASAAKREVDRLAAVNVTLVANAEEQANTLAVTEAALTHLAEAKPRIRTITKETIREIPALVPADACALPPGWRLLHDAAAAGEVPDPARAADEAPAPAQDAAETVIENYGTYHEVADQLRTLQEWVRGVSK